MVTFPEKSGRKSCLKSHLAIGSRRRCEFSVLATVSGCVRWTFAKCGACDVTDRTSREPPAGNPLQPSFLPQQIARRLTAAMCTAAASSGSRPANGFRPRRRPGANARQADVGRSVEAGSRLRDARLSESVRIATRSTHEEVSASLASSVVAIQRNDRSHRDRHAAQDDAPCEHRDQGSGNCGFVREDDMCRTATPRQTAVAPASVFR